MFETEQLSLQHSYPRLRCGFDLSANQARFSASRSQINATFRALSGKLFASWSLPSIVSVGQIDPASSARLLLTFLVQPNGRVQNAGPYANIGTVEFATFKSNEDLYVERHILPRRRSLIVLSS